MPTSRTDLHQIVNHIPGGVLRCLGDKDYTILHYNQSFLDIFGYTPEEIQRIFHNHYIEMIVPEDRKAVQDHVRASRVRSGVLEIEYRIICKDGAPRWVLEQCSPVQEDGALCYYCVMMDITEQRHTREELRLSLERHQIIMDQTTDIIFEWDIPADQLHYSGNWFKKFGYAPVKQDASKHIPATGHIHPEDLPAFMALMQSARAGTPYNTAEFRILNGEGRYIWCHVRATDQFNDKGEPVKAVGVISDIDEQIRMIEHLRKKAERDALTGLYNREETERQIEKYLHDCPEDETGALLMIDTDNFKNINDTHGHLFGDVVLTELASAMKKQLRSSDVVGRVGGDEFAVYLKDLPRAELAQQKAAQLLALFRTLFAGTDKLDLQVTGSIGIALFPAHARSFHSLYRCADQALYQAKTAGKNQYALYDPQRESLPYAAGTSALGADIDSNQETLGVSGGLVNYIFRILYETEDLRDAIHKLMEILGKRFDVSRVYIFENSLDGRTTSNTFEWCNEGITPEKELLQELNYAELENYGDNFAANGIFYCKDIRELPASQRKLLASQGIHAILQCAIREKGVMRGFIGFDECTGNRVWTQDEVSTLSLIAQMLSTFLLKQRAHEQDLAATRRMNSILDSQNAYIYVVDGDYTLLYLNRKTLELDPRAAEGQKCHQAFYGREAPCAHCPLRSGTGPQQYYNPQYGIWTMAYAAPLQWEEQDAYLITCFEVTEFMRGHDQKPH